MQPRHHTAISTLFHLCILGNRLRYRPRLSLLYFLQPLSYSLHLRHSPQSVDSAKASCVAHTSIQPSNSALVNHNRQYTTAMVAIEAVVIGSTAWKIAHTCLSAAFIGVPVLINAIYGSKQTSQPCNHNPIQHGDHFHYNNDIVQDTFEDDSQIYHHHHHHHNPGTITVSW